MEVVLELDNKGYVDINEKNFELQNDISFLDMIDNNSTKLLKNQTVLFYIDFENVKEQIEYKRIIKNIIKTKKKCDNRKINIGIENKGKFIVGVIKNYDKTNISHNDTIVAINAVLLDEKQKRYEYIYDKVCDYLDNEFINKNICNFENDKCIAKRNTNCTMGCCHHYKSKLGVLFSNKMQVCEYLKENTCTAKCISCKLFTCTYLQKQGIQFRIKDILLADCFFNIMQKIIIKANVFTPKEKIMKKIMFWS